MSAIEPTPAVEPAQPVVPVALEYANPLQSDVLPLHTRARAATIALAIAAALLLLATGTLVLQMRLLAQMSDGVLITQASADRNDALVGGAHMAALVAVLTAVVFVCIWQYRACHNLRAFGLRATDSPGAAVAMWFIPILNLWRPFTNFKDLWYGSYVVSNTSILGLWWFVWLAGLVLSRVESFAGPEASLGTLEGATVVLIIADLCRMTALVLLIVIIRRITEAQTLRATEPRVNG